MLLEDRGVRVESNSRPKVGLGGPRHLVSQTLNESMLRGTIPSGVASVHPAR
jgi:hypothetical protein